MGAMQTKILDAARKIVEDNGVEFVDQPKWYHNGGTVYLMDGFDTAGAFTYDFQDHYATFYLVQPGVKPCGGLHKMPGHTHFYVTYAEAGSVEKFLAALGNHVVFPPVKATV